MTNNPDSDAIERAAWPFNGYAPGHYFSKCVDCSAVKSHLDKRAIRCLECAVILAKAALAKPTPVMGDDAELCRNLRMFAGRGSINEAAATRIQQLSAEVARLRRKLAELGCTEIGNVDEYIAALSRPNEGTG